MTDQEAAVARRPKATLGGMLLKTSRLLPLRGASPTLFGPVFVTELLRTARRGRYVFLRCVYAVVLLLILWAVYLQFADEIQKSLVPAPRRVLPVASLTLQSAWRQAMPRFAEAFFSAFVCVQFAAVMLLTPVYAAGAIAEEKDRKTLEFLFATELRNHEIVLGKLVVCVVNVGMLVLTGLPVLCMMQLLGGVEPSLVLSSYAATALTTVSLASVCILISVYSSKTRDALVLCFLVLLGYLLTSLLGWVALRYLRASSAFVEMRHSAQALELFTNGNLILSLARLREAWDAGTPLTSILPTLLRNYATFHLTVALLAVVWATLRLRAVTLATRRPKKLRDDRTARHWLRPSIGRSPMTWKEVYAEPGMTFNAFGIVIVAAIVAVSFVPPLWLSGVWAWELVTGSYSIYGGKFWDQVSQQVNVWVRVVGTTVAILTLLSVAVRAAGCITGERDRQTLDGLLTSQLEPREILYAKWLGSILSVRWAWIWLSFVWGIGVLFGGLDVVTLPWLMLIWFVYAAFFACLGQRFSITSSTTARATLVTLAMLAVVSFGHWLPRIFFEIRRPPPGPGLDFYYWFFSIQAFGLTPPVALSWFAFRGDEIGGSAFSLGFWQGLDPVGALIGIVLGLAVWGQAAGWLWHTNNMRFAALTGRRIYPRPYELPPAPPAAARLADAHSS